MDPRQIYQELVKQGKNPKDAAKEAQAKTGMSVVSGRPINRQLNFTKRTTYYGQYGIPVTK